MGFTNSHTPQNWPIPENIENLGPIGTRSPIFSGIGHFLGVYLYFVYLGFLRRFQHCTGHITTGSWKGRGNQYIQFARVLYCKLPTNGKQLPAFPLETATGIEPRPQRWEVRVLPLCHRGPFICINNPYIYIYIYDGGHGGRVVTLSPLRLGSVPSTASSGKAGSCLPLVGSLQYRTLTNCMYWFPLPFQLPVVI